MDYHWVYACYPDRRYVNIWALLMTDWPLMPAEVFRMHFKPINFFNVSPAIDMPPSTQAVNKSVLATVEKKGCCVA